MQQCQMLQSIRSTRSTPNPPALPCPATTPGFDEPWERLLFKGRELSGATSLVEQASCAVMPL